MDGEGKIEGRTGDSKDNVETKGNESREAKDDNKKEHLSEAASEGINSENHVKDTIGHNKENSINNNIINDAETKNDNEKDYIKDIGIDSNNSDSENEVKNNIEDNRTQESVNNSKALSEPKESSSNTSELPSNLEANLQFQLQLKRIISTQNSIITKTSNVTENFELTNQITKDQINAFKGSVEKYGGFLLKIKSELGQIAELMNKIKKSKKK